VNITLHNPSSHIAFFQGVEVTRGEDGDEILPITYTDNDVTIFPGDSITLRAAFQPADLKGVQPWIRLEGYNTPKQLAAVK
jgi:exo-1,4-beta-D-glucosaminidase